MKKIILIVASLFCIAGFWLYKNNHFEQDKALTLYGNVDIREVNLGFRVAGKLKTLLVDEGDTVKQGDLLAQIDDEPYRNQVAHAVARVRSLQERLNLLKNGNRPQQIAQAQALLHEREVVMNHAKGLFKRAEQSALAKGISSQDLDNAEAVYLQSQAQWVSARENLSLLVDGFRPEDIAQAVADLNQAQVDLASAQLQLKDTLLTAPSDGVIYTRAQEAGSILAIGATVFTVSLQRPVLIRAYVDEPDLGRVYVGSPVNIFTDERPNQPYSGKVGFISPRAEFTPKSVETEKLRTALVYRIRIVVDTPDPALLQGLPVTIRLVNHL